MNWWKVTVYIIAVVGLFVGGFFIGRKTMPTPTPKESIKYIKGDPIEISVEKPVPVEVIKPIDTISFLKRIIKDGIYSELFPERVDTCYLTQSDTTTIMRDWESIRDYNEKLFDSDTLGSCSISAKVQYNRLQSLDYNYTPITKNTTTEIVYSKKFSPFIGAGFTMQPSIVGQVGLFFEEKYGVAVQYQYNTQLKSNSFGGLFFYKF